jgi:hypothetical protein
MRAPAEPVSVPTRQERDVVALALANAAALMSLVIYFMLTVAGEHRRRVDRH